MSIVAILMIVALICALIAVFPTPIPLNMLAVAFFFFLLAQMLGSGVVKLH